MQLIKTHSGRATGLTAKVATILVLALFTAMPSVNATPTHDYVAHTNSK